MQKNIKITSGYLIQSAGKLKKTIFQKNLENKKKIAGGRGN